MPDTIQFVNLRNIISSFININIWDADDDVTHFINLDDKIRWFLDDRYSC